MIVTRSLWESKVCFNRARARREDARINTKAQGYFQLDAFLAVRHRSSGSSLSPHESAYTQRACPRARTHNGRRSKFYPHLAIIQSCRFILFGSCASVLLPPAFATRLVRRSLRLPRVVTYTLVQRANIDKSAEAKTSER